MSTANKLTYLNGTKQAIKQAINEDFEVIDNNTTFREYADKISSNNAKYKDLIPKETKNATNTLDISNSAGLDKALVTQYGNTYQETTTGKNLLPNEITTQTTSGITITKNEDGSLTINGSTTAGVRLNFASSLTLQAGTYMVSTKETSSSQGYFSFYEGSTEIFVMSFRNQANKSFTLNEETTIRPTIYISNNGTFNNYTIYPMLEQGTTATDYEPYTNGASPNPDYPQEIQVVTGDNEVKVEGKNLIGLGTQLNGYVDQSTLKFQTNPRSIGYYFETSKLPNTITFSSINGNRANVCYFDEIPALSVVAKLRSVSNDNPRTITVDKTYPYIHIQLSYNFENVTNIQIESGSNATEYEPYQSASYPISLGNIELCKISTYKDRIYPLNGKWYLEKKIGKVVLTNSSGWSKINGATVNTYNAGLGGEANRTNANSPYLSNYFSPIATDNRYQDKTFFINAGNRVVVSYDEKATLSDFTSWLLTHNTTVYYVLATPTTEEITENNYPTLYNQLNNIKLFEGVNHITMTNESGLDVEFDITYYKDWKLD